MVATVDGGAMANILDHRLFNTLAPAMGALHASNRTLVVASGERIQSEGRWSGWISMRGERAEVDLEIFDSKGTFGILLGKPFLARIGAVQDYARDALRVGGGLIQPVAQAEGTEGDRQQVHLAHDDEEVRRLEAIIAGPRPPEEEEDGALGSETASNEGDSESDKSEELDSAASESDDESERGADDDEGRKWMDDLLDKGADVQALHIEGQSQNSTNLFAEERLTSLLAQVQIGADLSAEERTQIEALVREFADIFALSLSEVKPVDFIEHKLTIKEGASLPTRVHQRPLTEVQKGWYLGVLDEMEAAGIVCKISAEEVRCVSATTLAPKDSSGGGMTREEIVARANELCQEAGLPDFYVGEQARAETARLWQGGKAKGGYKTEAPTRWRICHAYMTLNKNTQVPPFPQGNLYLKQQRMAGRRWTSVIDFAAGYYAVRVAEESIPYTAFYVEGRGYYAYRRMPFGLTGAPTTFCEMVSQALDDMIGRELETWMDDICLAGNDFTLKMRDLRKFFERCRDRKLSLAPGKCKLFQTEVLFAGAKLSASGVGHNSKKVDAVLNWPAPANALELLGFLGLTNTYRRLIPGYASVAAPLTDLTRDVRPEKPRPGQRSRRGAYKAALRKELLAFKWGAEQERAFVALKCLVTSDQVMRPAVYDGRPFRVTSDASKVGFGAVLEQEYTIAGDNGKPKQYWHPIAFASKRTSRSEEKYAPFLLEFAALKFALDEFRPFVWGSPIEVETDCQALRDFLRREDLSATHARWRDALLEFMIIEVRHRPGKANQVGDGISRKWQYHKGVPQEGEQWTVSPDWEWSKGLVNDIYSISVDEVVSLQERFKGDVFFEDVISWLTGELEFLDDNQRRRAKHRAEGFMIAGGKLWKVGGKNMRGQARAECIPEAEGPALAKDAHEQGGHFGRDLTRLKLLDRYFWPKMNSHVTTAINLCGKCKNFGARHLNALLQPITHRKPFELIVGDYVSLPTGSEGYKTLGVYVDVFTQYVWAFKYKKAGTARTTIEALKYISQKYQTPLAFMADGGSHFTGQEVKEFCEQEEIRHITTPAYSPWVNGLAENTNKLIISRLRRLCSPDLNTTSAAEIDPDAILKQWPKHLETAIAQLNDRILPSTRYTPRELLFGMMGERDTPAEVAPETRGSSGVDETEAEVHMALAAMQRAEAGVRWAEHGRKRKARFDKRVREVEFGVGDTVQVYDSRAEGSHETKFKILPRWSPPVRVRERRVNSYELETLGGIPLRGRVHARRLRIFGTENAPRSAPFFKGGHLGQGAEGQRA